MKQKNSKKTVKTFSLASFLNDIGSEMIQPLWPLFLTNVIGVNMAVLGLIDGLGEAVVSLAKAWSGYVSDRIRKRKVFIWLGYLLGSFSRVGYALSGLWQQVLFFKIIDRAGKIRSAPRDAVIADISTDKDRGRNFGMLRAFDNLGAVVGVIVCILLFETLGFQKLFLLASVPSLASACVIFFFIKEKKLPKEITYKGLSFKDTGRDFNLFLLVSSFFALATFSYSFLLIYAVYFGYNIAFVPVLYLLYTALASILSIPFGRLSDKIGRKIVIIISYVFWLLACFSLIVFQTMESVLCAFILYGLHRASLEPVQKAFVAELSPKNYRASAIGAYQMVLGICALPASLIAGILWEKISIFAPLYFSILMTLVSIALFMFVKEQKLQA